MRYLLWVDFGEDALTTRDNLLAISGVRNHAKFFDLSTPMLLLEVLEQFINGPYHLATSLKKQTG